MIGSITKIVLCLALLVVLFHDGIVLGLAQVTVNDDAQVAARAAAQSYSANPDPTVAYQAAALSVASNGTDIEQSTFKIVDNGTVTLTASRQTSTMVADRFHFFDSLTHPTTTLTVDADLK